MTVAVDLLVVGICYSDLIYGGVPHCPEPGEEVMCESFQWTGGGSYITAVAARRLGRSVSLIAPFGTGPLEGILLDALRREGVDVSSAFFWPKPLPFVTVAMNYSHDRAFLTYVASEATAAFEAHLADALASNSAQWIHLNAHQAHPQLIDLCHRLGIRVSLNASWDREWLQTRDIWARVREADIFFLNEKEALAMTAKSTVTEALASLSEAVERVVITRGDRGCVAQVRGQSPMPIPALPVAVVDSTGAGDNLAAGVLSGLVAGRNFEESLRLGTFCAARSLTRLGGATASPTWHEAEEFLAAQ